MTPLTGVNKIINTQSLTLGVGQYVCVCMCMYVCMYVYVVYVCKSAIPAKCSLLLGELGK